MLRLAAISLCLVTSCGPSTLETNPPLARASSEPWVKEHRELVRAGCECKTSSCLEEHQQTISALEAEHGGLDESPADVHNAHGEFAQCYQAGTRDPIRDLKDIVRRLCGCTTEACVKQARISRVQYEDKYSNAAATPELTELTAAYDKCESEKIISGEALADHFDAVMSTVCGCAAKNNCSTQLTDLPPMPAAPLITRLDLSQPRIDQASERICNCAKNAGLLGSYGGFDVAARCKSEEKK